MSSDLRDKPLTKSKAKFSQNSLNSSSQSRDKELVLEDAVAIPAKICDFSLAKQSRS